MAASLKLKPSLQRLRYLVPHQRLCHTIFEGAKLDSENDMFAELGPKTTVASGVPDTSKWKKIDARNLGITLAMIPYASRTVLKNLQSAGHDAYLVGGCVRDLILNRIPKDFDVITTASLQEVKKKFHRAFVVGRRFPICLVHVRGSEIEVSSFETVTKHGGGKEEFHLCEMPKGYDEKDITRWRNSLHRDFTVNSLFYDPFAHKIYDYSNGIADLTAKKLRTLVPADSSFQSDCARILRGLRIAARLGFSFAEDTEKAVHDLYESVKSLDKARLMMEMNYMLSYGASQSSLLLLKKFNLLEILLPFHAAYLANHSVGQTSALLVKLFSNLDNVVSCDQPCGSVMWVSMLVFHLALVNNPQDAVVVWTFSSLLYHGTWKDAVKVARELSEEHVNFAPEIINSFDDVADDELVRRVSEFASIVLKSIGALKDSKTLRKIMSRYPSAPFPGAVFLSNNASRAATEIFDVLAGNIKSLKKKRHCYGIDYDALGKGDIVETRFVLGKVIMDTMRGGIAQSRTTLLSEKKDGFHASTVKIEQMKLGKPNSKNLKHETEQYKGNSKRKTDGPDDQMHQQSTTKQKKKKKGDSEQERVNKKLGEILSCQSLAKRNQQQKKEVVKDVNNLHSLQTEIPPQDTKLKNRQHCEAQTPVEIPSMLKNLPAMAKQHQTVADNEILYALEKGHKIEEQQDVEVPEETLENMLEHASEVLQSHKTKSSFNMLNVLKLSNLFDREGYHSKKCKPNLLPNESLKKKKTPKLSSIFK